MTFDLRLPNITASTPEGQMAQMRSYMYQLVEQLNWALNTVEKASNGESTNDIKVTGVQGQTVQKTPAQVFESIKELIIKSADIVNAYEETMRKEFDGLYVAESDFGTFKEETNLTVIANSNSITQLFTDTESISDSVAELEATSRNTNAYIRSGELDIGDDGNPIYGLEVGQNTEVEGETVFNKFARFTAGGIYFYLPSSEDAVAWMTGQKLYISNAQITGSLKLGGYVIDTSNGLAFKWKGGENDWLTLSL